MEAIDSPRFPEFDSSPFVTYNTESDVTPTESELVEELPEYELPPAMKAIAEGKPLEKPLRRGIGYLRAEDAPHSEPPDQVAEDGSATADSPDEDFGIGVVDSDARRLGEDASAAKNADPPTPGRKRRRRPRKRRPQSGTPNQSSVAAAQSSDAPPVSDTPVNAAESDGNKKPASKRNRRRRRRKSGGGGRSSPPTSDQ